MLRRPHWLRLLAGVLALWVGPVLADPPSLHACPMGDTAPGGNTMARMPGMPAAGAPARGDAGHPSHSAPEPGQQQSPLHGCTCPGVCTVAGAALVAVARRYVPAPATAHSGASATLQLGSLRSRLEHILPFPQAPPLAA